MEEHADWSKHFQLADYIVLAVMLALSTLIGVFFGCFRKQDTPSEYLLGNRQMTVFPITMSLIASYISGFTLLGVPAEIYTYGTQYFLANLANVLVGVITLFIFLPVFYKLQLVSLFQYLELRFNHKVRIIASLLFVISIVTFLPIVIYGPALVFNQVSGQSVQVVAPVLCTICIFYTTIGGLKAVVWSDALQGAFMLGSVLVVSGLGVARAGGVSAIFHDSSQGQRLEFFNMDPNPTTRLSFWSASFGLALLWVSSVATSPSVIQRFISLPTYKQAQKSLIYMTLGTCVFSCLCCFLGLIIYSTYQHCDLISAKVVDKADQILPYFIVDVGGRIPGLPGLFVAGIVCAALSTMSTGLNTLAGTVYEDFVEPVLGRASEKRASCIMKLLVIIMGTITTALVGVVEKLGPIIEMTTSFGGLTSGATLGIFTLGVLFPTCNSTGALLGGIVSLAFMTWITIGTQIGVSDGLIDYPKKPVSVDGCAGLNISALGPTPGGPPAHPDVLSIYWLSPFYYGLVGLALVLLVGMAVTYLTGPQSAKRVNPDLLCPLVQPLVARRLSSVSLPRPEPEHS